MNRINKLLFIFRIHYNFLTFLMKEFLSLKQLHFRIRLRI